MQHEIVTLRTCDLIGAALDWAVAKVCVAQGSVSIDPQDAQSGLPYLTFDAGGPSIWGAGREQRGTVNRNTGKPWVLHGPGGRFEPSTDWSQGGPLIDKMLKSGKWEIIQWGNPGVALQNFDNDCLPVDGVSYGDKSILQSGETALIAACRAIVSAHLGDSVDVPAELVGGGV